MSSYCLKPPFGVRFSSSMSPGLFSDTLEGLCTCASLGLPQLGCPAFLSARGLFPYVSWVRLCIRPSGPCSLPYSPASLASLDSDCILPAQRVVLVDFVCLLKNSPRVNLGLSYGMVGTNISALLIIDVLFFLRLTF